MTILEFTDKQGNIIRAIGSPHTGGEGDVYDVEGNPDLVVKIYNDKKRSSNKYDELITKIQAMCDICDDTIMQRAGWPQQIVYSRRNPVGFTMNKIKYCNTFHQLVDTIDRKEKFADNNWKYSLYVAYNLACAVNALHQKGIVIGDINESNFLIGNRTVAEENGIFDFKDNGIVYSIDCDSFQIPTNNKIFMCTVAKSEYLPPELVDSDLSKVIRTPNHDNFGLAVLIFQLLMLGKHPYIGIGSSGDIIESISSGNYIFGEVAKQNNILPPFPSEMYSTIYYSLNDEVRSLFEQAFGNDTNLKRPTAEDWIRVLKEQINEMLQCSKDGTHFYDKDSECIWCKISDEYGLNFWGDKINSNSSIAAAFNLSNTQTIQKTVQQSSVQLSNNVQSNNPAPLNTSNQLISKGFANYTLNGIYSAGGALYLYPDHLMFKGHKWNFQHHTKIIPLNEIIEVRENGFLISYSMEIVTLDGVHTFEVNPDDLWVKNLYELIDVKDVPFMKNIDYNGINAKIILWFNALDTVVELRQKAVEFYDGNHSVIWDIIKGFLKVYFMGMYRLVLRPFLILLFSSLIVFLFDESPSDDFLNGLYLAILALIMLFAFIPEKLLKQPRRRIIFCCALAALLIIFIQKL